ncbi:glycoside hydrolase family 31 protein [Sphingobacterium sp. N143]|uniref:glycoside hydrolase family 31 protein n=1 Tax=Sphingobacterium sp. N143 TaxID=2746727 RepID=UPI002576515F|nr:glycoside hydrolase family 31 protein [Sphingobacterium sp. N143]
MMHLKSILAVAILSLGLMGAASAQHQLNSTIEIKAGEHWWGGAVGLGSAMPFVKPNPPFDLSRQNLNNQVVPLLLSDKGRFLWSDRPFVFEVKDHVIHFTSEDHALKVQQAGVNLKSAFLAASKTYFPPSGIVPDPLFFSRPQYNTWIELMYNQNQQDILKYAQAIVDNDFPTGVLMIDDNWQKYYGNFDFRPEKFSDPKGMVDTLHNLGFKVMLWVCPFVSADSQEYRDLQAKGYLLKEKGQQSPAIISWWNGKSACYDMTNPAARDHFVAKLKRLQQETGIDGFKFDAGDNQFYDPQKIDSYDQAAIAVDHTMAWASIGLEFPVNEYRAGWKMGGQPLVQRLGDKDYSWNAVQMLIPDMIAAGLLGYAYTCPDMIGGGQFAAFLNLKNDQFDQKLIVRSAQVHALMPMMQFSVAPWRILDSKHLQAARDAALLHERFGSYILELANKSSKSGEPIVRAMEYEFPNEGLVRCKDQFMLGDRFLVAPVVTAEDKRQVLLPKGKWKDDLGKLHRGGKVITIDVPITRLPYFEKLND